MRIFFFIHLLLLQTASSLHLSMNQTIVSPGKVFELGFFNPSLDSPRWYVGIWYKKRISMSKKTYVWVANRDKPLYDSYGGTLKIFDGNIVLHDLSNNPVWSTNLERDDNIEMPFAELQDNGNLVLRRNQDFLWQSFDWPGDTLLPGMKFQWDPSRSHLNKMLRSWKSLDDPGLGDKYFRFERNGFPILSIWSEDKPIYRSGPWNGIKFTGAPTCFRLEWNRENVPSFSIATNNNSRLRINTRGIAILETWNQSTAMWNISWESSTNQCDFYEVCMPNSYCGWERPTMCSCLIKDFVVNAGNESMMKRNECKRNLNCGGDGFAKFSKVNIPDTSKASRYKEIRETKDCQKLCLLSCNCTAFSIIYSLEERSYSDEGEELYVRLPGKVKSKNRIAIRLIVGFSTLSAIIIILSIIYWFWRKRRQPVTIPRELGGNMEGIVSGAAPHISYGLVLKATHNFSHDNEIGRGGFGTVYKGVLDDGQEIAVKKLDKASSQGNTEFLSEVELIYSLQHINLVRLLGWSINNDNENEKALLYEYLPNGSLDRYIFDKTKSYELDWTMRLEIILGITRGLEYMQQNSRIRVVHRDIKPANILLDKEMKPKISDFGLARIIKRDENEVITTTSVGTRGYISPEFAYDGVYSTKSDAFAFGVTILEIVCGKSNRNFTYLNSSAHLPSCVWTKWREGRWEDIVDPAVLESSRYKRHEVLRCIEIGLLCVQATAQDRPDMSAVVLMLGNDSSAIPEPKTPGFFSEKRPNDPSSSTTYGGTSTAYQYTISEIIPRYIN